MNLQIDKDDSQLQLFNENHINNECDEKDRTSVNSGLNFINNVNVNIEEGLKQFSFIDTINGNVNLRVQSDISNDKNYKEEIQYRDSDV